jgi:IS30 family transposase
MSVRFSNKLVAELFQPFWAALQAGEFLTDAAAVAQTHRHRGLACDLFPFFRTVSI